MANEIFTSNHNEGEPGGRPFWNLTFGSLIVVASIFLIFTGYKLLLEE